MDKYRFSRSIHELSRTMAVVMAPHEPRGKDGLKGGDVEI